eukprot:1192378-Prorocentrum_minimum.AAC.1
MTAITAGDGLPPAENSDKHMSPQNEGPTVASPVSPVMSPGGPGTPGAPFSNGNNEMVMSP